MVHVKLNTKIDVFYKPLFPEGYEPKTAFRVKHIVYIDLFSYSVNPAKHLEFLPSKHIKNMALFVLRSNKSNRFVENRVFLIDF